jgi:integrase
LTEEEIEKLAEASTEPHLIRVAAFTGLRIGELLALRDVDVDLASRCLAITATAYKGSRSEGGTKTAAGRRTVPLTTDALHELWRQRELKLLRGIRTSEWAFPAVKGGAWCYSEFARKFKQWREAAGLPEITFHDLRHTFASLMVRAEAHPKVPGTTSTASIACSHSSRTRAARPVALGSAPLGTQYSIRT